MDNFLLQFEEFYYFFLDVLTGVLDFVFNSYVKWFLFVPIAVICIFYVIDLIFDVRDNFTSFNRFSDNFNYFIKYHHSKKKKNQKELDMNDVYKRSRENADYKHKLKMEELNYYKENENLRHKHKEEENEMYLKRYSIPKHKDKKKVNLDIEVED